MVSPFVLGDPYRSDRIALAGISKKVRELETDTSKNIAQQRSHQQGVNFDPMDYVQVQTIWKLPTWTLFYYFLFLTWHLFELNAKRFYSLDKSCLDEELFDAYILPKQSPVYLHDDLPENSFDQIV